MTCISTDGGLVKLYIGGPFDNDTMLARDVPSHPRCIVVFSWNEKANQYDGNSYVSPGLMPEVFIEEYRSNRDA